MKKLLIVSLTLAGLLGAAQVASAQAAGKGSEGASAAHSQAATPGAKGHHTHKGWSHSRHRQHVVRKHRHHGKPRTAPATTGASTSTQ